jgi:glycosyltransferase involved in cell wall biosynthesis
MLKMADAESFISRSSACDVLGETKGRSATIIYNAVPSITDTAPLEPSPLRSTTAILYVGNSTHRKRITVLPSVLQRIRQKRADVTLNIVGVEPSEVPHVVALFEELGQAGAVHWVGKLRSRNITPLYRSSSVLLIPSACEGLPMVILEAFANGLPCVATRVSGHPEVIRDGVNGYLTELDDPAGMAGRCLAILREPALAHAMGEQGRLTVARQFTLERQITEYERLYEDLMARAS